MRESCLLSAYDDLKRRVRTSSAAMLMGTCGCSRLGYFPFCVQDAQPRAILLDPHVREITLPGRHLAISFENAESVVRDNRYVAIVIHEEAVPVLFHGVHLEHPRLKARLDLRLAGAASIDIRLGDFLGVILLDPING